MIHEKFEINVDNSEFTATLHTYVLDFCQGAHYNKRPLVIICPGGAYGITSDREAEIIAVQFNAMGYHAAVLRYSVVPARYPTAILQLAKAVSIMRNKAKEWLINEEKIAVMGFSAGGHLAANYCTAWHEEWLCNKVSEQKETLRPNAMILCYPVITSGKFAHEGSFKNLLGNECEAKKQSLSLEKLVTNNVPQTFIWHTCTDQSVPVQNSLLLINSLLENNVSVEFHMYQKGVHGLSLANKSTDGLNFEFEEPSCQSWIILLRTWLENWE